MDVPRIIGDDGVLGVIYHDCTDLDDVPERARRLRAAMMRLQATTAFDQVLTVYGQLQLGTDLQYLASPTLMALDQVYRRWDEVAYDISIQHAFALIDEEMPLYRQLVKHVTMAVLVLEQGDVSLLRFMQERQLDLIYAIDLDYHAVHSDSPEMLDYLHGQKLLQRRRRGSKGPISANMAIHYGRNRSLEWMILRGQASLEACANDSELYTAVDALTRFKMLLRLGMVPPRILSKQMTADMVQEMLDRGVPISHWEVDACTVQANPATHLLLLRNGWKPHGESALRILMHDECRLYALAQGVLHPTCHDMVLLASLQHWDQLRDVLQHPNAFDITTKENNALWRLIKDIVTMPTKG
jgi:hypothetical protein